MKPATKTLTRPAATLAIALAAALILTLTLHHHTADRIQTNTTAHNTAQLRALLATIPHDHLPQPQPLDITLETTRLLAHHTVSKNGKTTAIIIKARALNGYNSSIDLLLAYQPNTPHPSIRVLQHQETPGITNFLEKQQAHRAIDGITGATITATAIKKTVEEITKWLKQNHLQTGTRGGD